MPDPTPDPPTKVWAADCPKCHAPMQVLFFLGVTPDYFACSPCQRLFDLDTLAPGPTVIGLD